MSNEDVADILERVADLLLAQQADAFRVRAYQNGAETVRGLELPLRDLFEEGGLSALTELPHIGSSLASVIQEILHRGRLSMLDRLEGEVSPEDLFTTVPGIGEELARRIHDRLHIETLEELELAAHDGRLGQVAGFGPRRIRAVREALGSMLSRSVRRRARRIMARGRDGEWEEAQVDGLSVAALLEVDRDYRTKAEAGRLPTIAPRRFNPSGSAWLPILHTEKGPWRITALYSNTARAHRLGRTHDWVVLYYERDGHEDQCTVVTERQGDLAGRRVVRGREEESRRYYGARRNEQTPLPSLASAPPGTVVGSGKPQRHQ